MVKLIDCKILQMDRFGVEYGYQPTDALFYVLECVSVYRGKEGGQYDKI